MLSPTVNTYATAYPQFCLINIVFVIKVGCNKPVINAEM